MNKILKRSVWMTIVWLFGPALVLIINGSNALADELFWDNRSGDGKWSTALNWHTDHVPGPDDDAIFDGTSDSDCTVDAVDVNVASIVLDRGYRGTVILNNDIEATDVVVKSGTLLCAGDPTVINEPSGGTPDNPHGKGIAIAAGDVTVEAGGHISADGQGFPPTEGPGGNSRGAPTHDYGSVSEPTALGSGGDYYRGFGGGAIRIIANGTVRIEGTVSANGGGGYKNRGGGSGGSVWITASVLTGSGSIFANGGAPRGDPKGDFYQWSFGGGGKISLQWDGGNNSFGGIISGGSISNIKRRIGTLYVTATGTNAPWDELWDADRHVRGQVSLLPGNYDVSALYVDRGGMLVCRGDTNGVNEASGGTCDRPHGSGVTFNSEHIFVQEGGVVTADECGFQAAGPGYPGVCMFCRGATHAGRAHGHESPSAYGSASEPTALGSGGGGLNRTGGPGGGAIKLNAAVSVHIDGTVSACGGNGYKLSGGGSGGSIWIVTDRLSGSGSIMAEGGPYWGYPDGDIYNWFGGGGGRISIQYSPGNNAFEGFLSVLGPGPATQGTIHMVEAVEH